MSDEPSRAKKHELERPDEWLKSGDYLPTFMREEYDDGTFVCPDCGEQEDDTYMAVESYERFGKVLCDLCFERRCEREEDGE